MILCCCQTCLLPGRFEEHGAEVKFSEKVHALVFSKSPALTISTTRLHFGKNNICSCQYQLDVVVRVKTPFQIFISKAKRCGTFME